MVDRRELIRVANPAAVRLFGHGDQSLIDQPIETLTDDDALRRAFTDPITRAPDTDEFNIIDRHGELHVLNVAATVLEEEQTSVA